MLRLLKPNDANDLKSADKEKTAKYKRIIRLMPIQQALVKSYRDFLSI